MKTFVEAWLSGEVGAPEVAIDDWVDKWHHRVSVDPPMPLNDWLGFTPSEYARWVEQPTELRSILTARKRQFFRTLNELLGCIEVTAVHGWWGRESTAKDLTELAESVISALSRR